MKKIFSLLLVFISIFTLASCNRNIVKPIADNEITLTDFHVEGGCTSTNDKKSGMLEQGSEVSLAISLSNPKGYAVNTITFKFEGEGAVVYNTNTYKFIKHQTEGASEGTTLTWDTIDNGKFFFFTNKSQATLKITLKDDTDVKFSHIKISITDIQYGSKTSAAKAYIGNNNFVDLYACKYDTVEVNEIGDGHRTVKVVENDPNLIKGTLKVLNENSVELKANEDGLYDTTGSIIYLSYKIKPTDGPEFSIEPGSTFAKYVIYVEPKK